MKRTLSWPKEVLSVAAKTLLVIVGLPLLALAALLARGVLVPVLVGALVVGTSLFLFSRRFRSWLEEESRPELGYKGLRWPRDVSLYPSHCWARIEPDEVVVGADDFTQAVLGPVRQVELPAAGRRVRQGEGFARLRHRDRTVELLAPVSGTVVGSNDQLRWQPWRVNEEPYTGGWITRLRAENLRSDAKELLSGKRARAWFRGEIDRLVAMISEAGTEKDLAPSLPDGGVLGKELLYREIDTDTWERLVESAFGRKHGAAA